MRRIGAESRPITGLFNLVIGCKAWKTTAPMAGASAKE